MIPALFQHYKGSQLEGGTLTQTSLSFASSQTCFFHFFFPVLVSAVQLDILMSTDSRGNRMAGLSSLMHIKVTSWKRSQKVLRYQKIGNYNTQLSESTSTIA